MKIAGIKIKRRFFVSVGLVIAVTGTWFYWNRLNQIAIGANPAGEPQPFVRIAGSGEGERNKLLEDQAEYFDPTPRFLPTLRNFQQGALPDRAVKQPGQVFQDFEPKFNFTENTLPDYGVTTEAGSHNLAEVLARGNDAPFAGFGRSEQAVQATPRRLGYIEVKSLRSGNFSLTHALTDIDLPSVDYAPVDFIIAVASTGLLGDPVMIASSGKEEIDGRIKDYLVNSFRLGERLAPGRYVVSVGP